ncbi:hypothetical protein GALMADRAFT_249033 [Galerina marginata CBS 339.88]|uniref:Uncharacterized protein n=1 Tax=Galerina marginata (strain CBS 339.88) TaxID=685588 RepID=A0A067SW07_GALM3|nr:hypothetical protein GALMADRAFT_249033 [Galerina marginata CBS 339.88]
MEGLRSHSFKPDRRSRSWSSNSRPLIRTRLHRYQHGLISRFKAQRRPRRTLFASMLIVLALYFVFFRESLNVDVNPRVALPSLDLGVPPNAGEGLPEVVNGPPTARFRDNLKNDSSYITSWSNAGFTNQFMNYVNMIYLGTLTDRIPIIPPFAPDHHISSSAGIIPFGDIFDLDQLRQQLRLPILEWRDVKKLPSRYSTDPYSTTKVENLGCWTTRKENEGEPIRAENVVHHLGLDVSYTRVPTFTRLEPWNRDEPHVVFPKLAALIYPRDPIASPDSFPHLAPSPFGHHLPPEAHISCFDTMYYATSGSDHYEWRFSWSPVWRTVGRHLQFTQEMKDLGRQYLARVFGLEGSEEIPPFIVVHVRHGDFAFFCGGHQDCFPPLSAYQAHVDKIKRELIEKRSLPVPNVVLVSGPSQPFVSFSYVLQARPLAYVDEKSPLFWNNVKSHGWFFIDHAQEKTFERLGEWYPPLVDIVIQIYAVGFVGTEDSTFSLVGQRRVQDWNDGVTLNVNVRNGY